MPTVVNTDTSAAKNSTLSIRRSRTWRARRRFKRGLADSCRTVDVACPGATADIRKPRILEYENRFRLLELRFAAEQLFDGHAHLGDAAEDRALASLLHVLERHPVGGVRQRH